MFNDKSMLQYGFLQSGEIAELVHGLDRHDFESNPGMSEEKRQLPSQFAGESSVLQRYMIILLLSQVFCWV
jgi:hypothetical protein